MSAPSHPSHLNGSIREAAPKCSSTSLQNGGLESGPEPHSPHDACSDPPAHSALSSRTPASVSPLRTLRSLMNPESSSSSSRPRGQSLSSALTTRTRTTGTRRRVIIGSTIWNWFTPLNVGSGFSLDSVKPQNWFVLLFQRSSSQQEGPDALLDLILESQGQRLNDQRASLSLLPDPEPTALCGTCSPSQTPLPSLDFYYMLIHYQVAGSVFSLQSRSSLLVNREVHTAVSGLTTCLSLCLSLCSLTGWRTRGVPCQIWMM